MDRKMLNDIAKAIIFQVLGSAPAIRSRLRESTKSARITILNFHRVAPDDGSTYKPLSPQLFEDVVRFCKDKFELRTFEDLGKPATSGRPTAIISFDDGYADFMEYSDPILRKHGVRANHNVIPGCVESGRPPHNVVLQDFLGQTGETTILRSAFDLEDGPDFGNRVSAKLKAKPMAEQNQIMASLTPVLNGSGNFRPTPMMTLSDWKEAARHHEIGAHSFEHATLEAESDDYVREDGRKCQRWLQKKLDVCTSIYALPNGKGRPGVEELLAESGFTTILYTGELYGRLGALNRFTMYGTSLPELRARATGWTRG